MGVLLLLLLWLKLLAVSLELRRSVRLFREWCVNHTYFAGAPLELPPVGLGVVLFLFFSSTTSQALMVPS
jgi:hypothetical protein